MSGGQPDGARLLELARRELLENVLPAMEGEARYRLRLIANAMKIAAFELEAGPLETTGHSKELRTLTGRAPDELRDALRSGELDGDSQLYELLTKSNAQRRRLLGQD